MKEKILFIIKRMKGLKVVYVLGTFCVFVDFLINIIYPFLLQEMVDQLYVFNTEEEYFLTNCIKLISFIIIQTIVGIVTVFLFRIVRKKIIIELESDIIDRIENVSGSTCNALNTGFISNVLSEDVEVLAVAFSDFLVRMLVNLIQIIVVAYILISINLRIAFVVFLGEYIYILLNFCFSKKIEDLTALYRSYYDEKNSIVQEYISKFITLIKLNCNDFFRKKILQREGKIQEIKMKSFLFGASNAYVGSLIRGLLIIIIYYFSSSYIRTGNMTLGELSAIIVYAGYFSTPILSIAESLIDIKEIKVSFDRILNFMNITKCSDVTTYIPLNHIEKIEFKNVYFRYEDVNIINGVCFSVNEGEMIAIVGENGAGKSTLIDLLIGFLRAEEGSILLNDNEISNYAVKNIRNRISIMTQEKCIFEDTILNNLTLGQEYNQNQIMELCNVLDIKDYIDSRVDGIYSAIDNDGHNLSEGQKQKLSIIRTLVKTADVIILDEATSNMDNVTEQCFVEKLRRIAAGRIVIVISHRVPILKEVDRIYVLRNGKFIANGSHNQLMDECDYYTEKICVEGLG